MRTKLLLFAFALVTLPGIAFAVVAFSGARSALEREVGIQLHQTAERGAEALATSLERARGDVRSWASQDVMRDLLVGDLDKRVSRFLHTVQESKSAYLEALCAQEDGTVVAASSGSWIGRNIRGWQTMRLPAANETTLLGPIQSADFSRNILEIGTPVRNPDAPDQRIARLILVYDWRGSEKVLDTIRIKLAGLGKHVAALVVDEEGAVVGGVSFDGRPAIESPLAEQSWRRLPANGYGKRAATVSDHSRAGVLVGGAVVSEPRPDWSVLFIERSDEALAPVGRIRSRWVLMISSILLVGLAVAALLARQFMRPLDEVTRATSKIASHPDEELPLLPVRSRNEVGQLTGSFNKMTVELKRSQEEALSAAKFAFAGELAAMVAHEVRTPLSVMRCSARMLATSAAGDGLENAELVETIVAEVDRIERVVTGLLQLARPVEQRLEPTWLREVLSRAVDFAAAQARKQNVRLTCDFDPKERLALCDPEQIYQVVLNLVVNALQALPPGGSIRLQTFHVDSSTVGFEVRDDGPGLPAELRERIFQPFVTGREEGTGLGLAFVDRIVKAHGGSIVVQSETGKGTAFQVQLPAAGGRPAPSPP